MRNLLPVQRRYLGVLSTEAPDLPISASTWDPTADEVICVLGPTEEDPMVEVKRVSYSGKTQNIAHWESPLSESTNREQVLDVHYFADTLSICVIFSGGNIVVIQENEEGGENSVEIVGSVDEGIAAACWSPDEEIVAISTRASTLLLMTRQFDPISDITLKPEDVKASKHVNVGWGKSETQFKGKRAKAMSDPTVPEHVDEGVLSPNDNGRATITWRGDGQYVALSTVEKEPTRRLIRVYTRDGQLDSASEPVDGLEGQLSWRPSGNLIASIQRQERKIDVVFFERNGLRHGEFTLPIPPERISQENILQLLWNSDSTVLAVVFEDRTQLWTMGNYHYYLKQEIYHITQHTPKLVDGAPIIAWHPERSLKLCISLYDMLDLHDYVLSVARGTTRRPHDYGVVAVIDGYNLKLTPLRTGNVPPPMALCDIKSLSTPIHVCINNDGRAIALLRDRAVDIISWDPSTRRAALKPELHENVVDLKADERPRQIAFINPNRICILRDTDEGSCKLDLYTLDGFKVVGEKETFEVEGALGIIASLDQTVIYANTRRGEVLKVDLASQPVTVNTLASLPTPCPHIEVAEIGDKSLVCGLTENGKLFANGQLIAPNCNSFQVTDAHLAYTTTQHFLKFIHLGPDVDVLEVPPDDPANDERCRNVERGSRIVHIMPTSSAVVLQMPRGNLETIYPRALVLAGIRRNIQDKNYKDAFLSCRTNRVDMNILHDHMPAQFFEHIELVIDQLGKVEYIDLVLSQLREEDVTKTMYHDTTKSAVSAVQAQPGVETNCDGSKQSKVNAICDAMIAVLSERLSTNIQNVITAYVCKNPPDHSAALQLVSRLRDQDMGMAEKAVEHVCFLSDVNKLYDNALGLYDLPLTLMIAEQSQKDPREYLPFIQSLDKMEDLRKKFTIDDHLGRYSKALSHLHGLGDSAFDELVSYTVRHELYQAALDIYLYEETKQAAIMSKYAVYLDSCSRFEDAGIAYEFLKDYSSAMEAYRRATLWKGALFCASMANLSDYEMDSLATDLAEALFEMKDYQSSATVYLDYKKDVAEAARTLCKGSWFAEAMRIVSNSEQNQELLDSVVDQGLTEAFGHSTELIADCKAQVKAQTKRLWELRKKKEEDPLSYFEGAEEEDAPDNVSLAPTSASTSASLFTRYTAKTGLSTAHTGATRRTSKNKRREERKRARGKKGSIYEEEYLVNSIGRLVERLETVRPETERLVQGLLRRGMRQRAKIIDNGMREVWEMVLEVEHQVWNEEWLNSENEEGVKRSKPVFKKYEGLTQL